MPTAFAALANSIAHQQLATGAGRAIGSRLHVACGGNLCGSALLALSDEELRAVGLSGAKIRSLRALAAADVRGELEGIEAAEDEIVVARLVRLPGIGDWTARMFLLFHLRRADVFSGDDFGLREGIRVLDGQARQPTRKEAVARAAVWQPYRSVASLSLWDLVRRTRLQAR
jgi:3-methyladenine DNA glycosylase/8-oxoguanine DNA glycosylase